MSAHGWRVFLGKFNFFRIHLVAFTLIPLISAAIFFASNGEFHVGYTDALFTCISAMTGTGLQPFDLSGITPWQQVILVILELTGSPVAVSWIAVYVRKRYFTTHLRWIVHSEFQRTRTREAVGTDLPRGRYMTSRSIRRRAAHTKEDTKQDNEYLSAQSGHRNYSSDVIQIHRVDTAPRPIASMDIDASLKPYTRSPERFASLGIPGLELGLPPEGDVNGSRSPGGTRTRRRPSRRGTVQTINPEQTDDAFGGFGDPFQWIFRLFKRTFPRANQRVQRTMTIDGASSLLVPAHAGEVPEGAKPVPYLSFPVRVAHNSRFLRLSDDDCEELGGIEYRALNALLWIVPLYYIGTLSVAFVVIAPYMSLPRWKHNFLPPNQHKVINPVWYSLFEIVGAWANTGMSLVDQNLIPFQRAYPMIILLMYCVLAGATGFPVFLRFMIWAIYKFCPRASRLRETLHFLLDHPRRCFIYMFPSQQTWFLFTVLLLLNMTDWFFFLVLDIGNPTVEAIPVGVRILLGAAQAVAVRLAGFQAVPVAALAPAVKVLYCTMMYVSAYPVAMSVRSTNVYEEKSLGVFSEDDEDINDIDDPRAYPDTDSRVAIWGRYLARHVRRQLSFDMWWLCLALFLLCIIERENLNNPDNFAWFNIFALIFELVSAYATVGLSLGIPTANYSLVGAMHTLSKLIIGLVMLRGRHRGLPVALDRAVLLPTEFLQKASEKAREMKRREVAEKLPAIRENPHST
ncbi:TrkH-domain-containing protein [Artomyces pyxidatus]|uniref:TrkH-domain-containing protein n=1 Tax=Artomyces pyxidatus TaxID=48021 RepID=A0ACB8SWS9_9AGAM|nr:TrkH-domain-containing protein [Artomyces pyxidatus]